MSLHSYPRTVKWPFLLGDFLLITLAGLVYAQASLPLNPATLTACVACIALGAVIGVVPFVMDYRATVRLAESDALTSTVQQIQNIESIASQITSATAQWQAAQDHARDTVTSARDVSGQMQTEMKSFTEFLEKANDSERQHLRLEVDKFKRAESDWLGVTVRILDHVFALHVAAVRSGNESVTHQLTQFQNACRDTARRIGVTPFEVEPGAPFDATRHQLPEGQEASPEARVAVTIATGYTFRAQVIRPALVSLEGAESPVPMPASASGTQETEQQLSL